ncbi:MAG: hypothetical protein K1X64_01090 [Myxococcaceae bacterium]|nr:hypothetical protein [Myxococcaceae bacterium]
MKFTVRTPDGELTYSSFGAVEQAWLNGLVGPDDLLQEEGHTQWRKASSFPLLMQARRHGDAVWGGMQQGYLIAVIVVASITFWMMVLGSWFSLLPLFLTTALLARVTYLSVKKNKPY